MNGFEWKVIVVPGLLVGALLGCALSLVFSCWMLRHLLKFGATTRPLLLSSLLRSLAVADIGIAVSHMCFTVGVTYIDRVPPFMRIGIATFTPAIMNALAIVANSIDTCIAVCTAIMVREGDRGIGLVRKSHCIAWILGAIFLILWLALGFQRISCLNGPDGLVTPECLGSDTYELGRFAESGFFALSFPICIGAYIFTICHSRREVGKLAVVRRIAQLYVVKSVVIEGLWIVRTILGCHNKDWRDNGTAGLLLGCYYGSMRGVLDEGCYGYSADLIRSRLRQWVTRVNAQGQEELNQDSISLIFKARLDLMVVPADDLPADDLPARGSPSASYSLEPGSSRPDLDTSPIHLLNDNIWRKYWEAQAELKQRLQELQCSIYQKYVQEIAIQDFAELLGVVSKTASEIQAGLDLNQVYPRAYGQCEQQKLWLEESIETRLKARKAVDADEVRRLTIKNHQQNRQATTALLEQLGDPAAVPGVQAIVIKMLIEQQKKLYVVSEAKETDSDTWFLGNDTLISLIQQEQAFTKAAVQIAEANQQSVILQCVALQAITRTIKSIKSSGVHATSSQIDECDEWHRFAASRLNWAGCSAEARLAADESILMMPSLMSP